MDDLSVIEEKKYFEMEWNEEHEKIMIDWADKAMIYRWLHSNCHSVFYSLNLWFTIPVIIISTLTGTANFAQDRVPVDFLGLFVMIVGSLNILAGIISTIQQFLKITELKESHRVSSIAWDKFYRNIKIELSKKPQERIPVAQMLKIYKEEYDRLMETSPVIPIEIVKKFNDTFKNTPNFSELKKPEICDSLISTTEFVYKENKEKLDKAFPFVEKLRKEKEKNEIKIKDYIEKFKETQGREPLREEILENLTNEISIGKLNALLNSLETKEKETKENHIKINVKDL
jgi:hypothetical protein